MAVLKCGKMDSRPNGGPLHHQEYPGHRKTHTTTSSSSPCRPVTPSGTCSEAYSWRRWFPSCPRCPRSCSIQQLPSSNTPRARRLQRMEIKMKASGKARLQAQLEKGIQKRFEKLSRRIVLRFIPFLSAVSTWWWAMLVRPLLLGKETSFSLISGIALNLSYPLASLLAQAGIFIQIFHWVTKCQPILLPW